MFHERFQPIGLKPFGVTGPASCAFRKDHSTPLVFLNIFTQFGNLNQGLFTILSIDQDRSPVSEIIRNAWDPLTQFNLAYKFWVMAPHIPYYRRNVVHALMIGYNDQGPVFWYFMGIIKGVPGAQHQGDPDQYQIKDADTFFMGIVPEKVQTYPLDRMEDNQNNSKKNEI